MRYDDKDIARGVGRYVDSFYIDTGEVEDNWVTVAIFRQDRAGTKHVVTAFPGKHERIGTQIGAGVIAFDVPSEDEARGAAEQWVADKGWLTPFAMLMDFHAGVQN